MTRNWAEQIASDFEGPPPGREEKTRPDLVVLVSSVSRGIIGGILEYLKPLQRLLPQHQIAVRTFLYPRTLNLMESRGLPKFARIWLHLAFVLLCLLRIARLARRHRQVLVHSHGASYALLVGFLARIMGRPALHTFHSANSRRSTTLRLVGRRLDGLVFASESLEKEYKASSGVANEVTYHIPGAVDVTLFHPADGVQKEVLRKTFLRQYGLPDRGTLVLFMGRITPEKGVLELIEAISVLRNRQCPTSAVLAGPCLDSSQAYLRHIEARISDLGLSEWVVLAGPVTHPTKVQLMAAADVFVCPSRWEGSPLSVAEALASGVPVVATRVGGLVEQIPHGEAGLLVDESNPARLADAIGSLLTSESTRLQMARKAREHAVGVFGEDAFVEKHIALYAESVRRLMADQPPRGVRSSPGISSS